MQEAADLEGRFGDQVASGALSQHGLFWRLCVAASVSAVTRCCIIAFCSVLRTYGRETLRWCGVPGSDLT